MVCHARLLSSETKGISQLKSLPYEETAKTYLVAFAISLDGIIQPMRKERGKDVVQRCKSSY